MHRALASSTTRPRLCSCSVTPFTLWNPSNQFSSFSRNPTIVRLRYIRDPQLEISWNCKDFYFKRINGCYMSTSGNQPDSTGDSQTMHRPGTSEKDDMNSKKARFEKFFDLVRERKPQFQSIGTSILNSSKQSDPPTKAATVTTKKEGKEVEDWNDILNRWYESYQNFIGITDLKNAQDRVTELSESLLETQSKRRELQAGIEKLQEDLIVNQQRITKTELYSDEHYTLFDQAREMNSSLKTQRSEFEICERAERDTYSQLSAAIRDCHERERFQAEQSKYWSIIASVVSAALASIITSVNNWVRIREVKDHVTNNSQQLMSGYIQMHDDVINSISNLTENAFGSTPKGVSSETAVIPKVATSETVSAPKVLTGEAKAPVKDETQRPTGVSEHELTIIKESVGSTKKDMALLIKAVGSLKEEMSTLSKSTEQTLKDHVASLMSEERKVLYRQINSQLENVFAKVFLTSEKNTGENPLLSEESSKSLPLSWDDQAKSEVVLVDYSYRRIATAMAVGAGIGTLVTAFMLGSFPANG